MDNKYWKSENELDEGIDGINGPRSYEVHKHSDLTEIQANKAQEDFTNYFYCPICGKESLLKEAVIRKLVLNRSFGFRNAAMPGWMKISASEESCYIRVCPQCETKRLPEDVFERSYVGNAIETRKGKIRAAENSGCMVFLATIVGIASLACWMLGIIIK